MTVYYNDIALFHTFNRHHIERHHIEEALSSGIEKMVYDKIHNIEVNNSKELLYYLNPELTVRNLLKIKTKF